MGFNMMDGNYYWVDGGFGDGVRIKFIEIYKYGDVDGCGYIYLGVIVSMIQCDVREGFICEYICGKEIVKMIDCDEYIVFNYY